MNSNSLLRIRILSAGILLVAFVILGKLYMVQVVNGDVYRAKVNDQYVQEHNVIFDRGTIFFESKDGKRLAAATVQEGFVLAINPKTIGDAGVAYDAITTAASSSLVLDREAFIAKATKVNDPYEEINNRVSRAAAESIRVLKLPGVILEKTAWRLYPGGTTAAHTLGLLGQDDKDEKNELLGRYGLERSYEEVLHRDGNDVFVNFFAEIFAGIKKTVFDDKPLEGDIVTTIDPTLQNYIESALTKIQTTWASTEVGAIVIDPRNGEIYAMAARPSFDPNVRNVSDPKVFSNPLVENAYELGSIMKPVTMVAGIEAGVITPKTTFLDKGFITLDGKTIKNFDSQARGTVDMQQVLNHSLNTGASFVVSRIGKERFADYLRSFGVGEKTGIDLPNEQRGIASNLNSKGEVEFATASFGQGISLTPIGMTRVLSVLANGGMKISPHVVRRIEYSVGGGTVPEIAEPVRVISKDSAEQVSRMLVEVVDTALKKGSAKLTNYSVAAKTGTAQIADPTTKSYYSDRYLHSFFGYFPAYDARFLVLLYQINPQGTAFAADTLTEPFFDIANFLINYYEIPPDR